MVSGLLRDSGFEFREFLALSPPKFTGTNQREDPQHFIDQLGRIFKVMHATRIEGVEFSKFRLQDIVILWYERWEMFRGKMHLQ